MPILIPPPPTRSDQSDRVWTDWYIRLRQVLSSTAGIAWALVDKTGSSLSDIATRNHSQLTAIAGTGNDHISTAEGVTVTLVNTLGHGGLTNILGNGNRHVSEDEGVVLAAIEAGGHQGLDDINGTGNVHISTAEAALVTRLLDGQLETQSGAADPTTGTLPVGYSIVYHNTTANEVRVWTNIAGTLRKSAVFT